MSCALTEMNATEQLCWYFSISSGKGLMPSGNKLLPEPVLSQINVTISMG